MKQQTPFPLNKLKQFNSWVSNLMKQQTPFPLYGFKQLNSWISNLLIISAFCAGAGVLVVFIPTLMSEELPQNTSPYAGCVIVFPMWLIMVLVLWAGIRLLDRRERNAIQNITEGKDLLAMWQYTAMEWQELAEMQTNAEEDTNHKQYFILSLPLVGAMFTCIAFSIPSKTRIILLPIGALVIFMLLFSSIVNHFEKRILVERNRARRAENLSPKLYISRKGIYHETEGLLEFDRIQNMNLDLASAYPKLMLKLLIRAGMNSVSSSLFIPIPRRHVTDVQQLVEQLNLKTP